MNVSDPNLRAIISGINRAQFYQTLHDTNQQIKRGPDQSVPTVSEGAKQERQTNLSLDRDFANTQQSMALNLEVGKLMFLLARTYDPAKQAMIQDQLSKLSGAQAGNFLLINIKA